MCSKGPFSSDAEHICISYLDDCNAVIYRMRILFDIYFTLYLDDENASGHSFYIIFG